MAVKPHSVAAYGYLAAKLRGADFERITGLPYADFEGRISSPQWGEIRDHIVSTPFHNLLSCWKAVRSIVYNNGGMSGYWVCNAITLVTDALNPALYDPMIDEVREWLLLGKTEKPPFCSLVEHTATLKACGFNGQFEDYRRIRLEFIDKQIAKLEKQL